MTTQKTSKASFLSVVWNRLKYLFTIEDRSDTATLVKSKLYCRVRYLERCLLKDCPVEENRKRLERTWKELSS